jgi:hypothetical protein
MHLHEIIYPSIHVKRTINLRSETLNNFFKNKYNVNDYNFINIDIQDAELLAFQRTSKTLKSIQEIYTEVKFKEL